MTNWIDCRKRNLESAKLWAYFDRYWNDIDSRLQKLNRRIEVHFFDNGRERGYTLKDWSDWDLEISFTESRNSDCIKVYPFKWEDNPFVEKDYDEKTKSFCPKEPHYLWNAFNFILEYLGIDSI